MTAAPTFSSVDEETANLLTVLAADWRPFADRDRNTIAQAIRRDAAAHAGWISPNRVRADLAKLPVSEQPKPQRVGSVYRSLLLEGVLAVDAWEVSDDLAARNAGKPHRTYRWAGAL